MKMTVFQQIITIAVCSVGTMITRFLPFIIFPADKKTPEYILYLGKVLPSAIFGMLIVYCFKNVSFVSGTYGIPEIIAAVFTIILHLWKRQMLISIAGGTICYMLLVQMFF